MTAPKFTHRDRLLLAGMIEPSVVDNGTGRVKYPTRQNIAAEAIVRADALLTALAETPAPACVGEDMDALDIIATLLPSAEKPLSVLEGIEQDGELGARGMSELRTRRTTVEAARKLLRENGRLL